MSQGPPPLEPARDDVLNAAGHGLPVLNHDSAVLSLHLAASAVGLPAAEGPAFLGECGDLLEATMRAGERAPGVVLGPLLARYEAGRGATSL